MVPPVADETEARPQGEGIFFLPRDGPARSVQASGQGGQLLHLRARIRGPTAPQKVSSAYRFFYYKQSMVRTGCLRFASTLSGRHRLVAPSRKCARAKVESAHDPDIHRGLGTDLFGFGPLGRRRSKVKARPPELRRSRRLRFRCSKAPTPRIFGRPSVRRMLDSAHGGPGKTGKRRSSQSDPPGPGPTFGSFAPISKEAVVLTTGTASIHKSSACGRSLVQPQLSSERAEWCVGRPPPTRSNPRGSSLVFVNV